MKVNTNKPCNTCIELRGDITQIDKMIQELGMIVSGEKECFLCVCIFNEKQQQNDTQKYTGEISMERVKSGTQEEHQMEELLEAKFQWNSRLRDLKQTVEM